MAVDVDTGFEFSLFLRRNAKWVRVFTYYNCGEEPPHGGVRSEEAVNQVEWTVGEFERLGVAIDGWVRDIRGMVKIPDNHLPDLPLDYKIESDEDGVHYKITMETLDSEVNWSPDTKKIVFEPRDAFDISWAAFLFYHKTMNALLEKIRGYPS